MCSKRKKGAKRKLSKEQEQALLAALKMEEVPVGRLAEIYGISRQTVYNIQNRQAESAA
jgi:DNA invertase Pin-like site-specific DNA recombinase